MFALLRNTAIIGAIFYLSPVHESGTAAPKFDDLVRLAQTALPAAGSPETVKPGQLEALWNALPERGKQAVLEKIVSSSHPAPSALNGKPAASSDTLQAEDRKLSWRGAPEKRLP